MKKYSKIIQILFCVFVFQVTVTNCEELKFTSNCNLEKYVYQSSSKSDSTNINEATGIPTKALKFFEGEYLTFYRTIYKTLKAKDKELTLNLFPTINKIMRLKSNGNDKITYFAGVFVKDSEMTIHFLFSLGNNTKFVKGANDISYILKVDTEIDTQFLY